MTADIWLWLLLTIKHFIGNHQNASPFGKQHLRSGSFCFVKLLGSSHCNVTRSVGKRQDSQSTAKGMASSCLQQLLCPTLLGRLQCASCRAWLLCMHLPARSSRSIAGPPLTLWKSLLLPGKVRSLPQTPSWALLSVHSRQADFQALVPITTSCPMPTCSIPLSQWTAEGEKNSAPACTHNPPASGTWKAHLVTTTCVFWMRSKLSTEVLDMGSPVPSAVCASLL